MKIITDRNLVVYYYKDLEDLLTKEKELNDLQISFHMIGEESPVRICPRGSDADNMYYILLWNSGSAEEDLKTLKSALGHLKMEFRGEL